MCYPGQTSTPHAGITTIKTHWNSVISTPNAKHSTININDIYLNSKLENFEYMRTPYDMIPQGIMNLYNLDEIVNDDDFVYIEVQGGMHGFPQSGKLAHDELVKHLKPYGYEPMTCTPGLWSN